MTLPPALVIHGAAHARLALAQSLACARPATLLSAPGAAGFAGCLWWRAVLAAAGATPATPDILDCGPAPGLALEALDAGCRILVLAPGPAWSGIAARAQAQGARLLQTRPPALDLAPHGAARRIAAWLAIG